LAVIETGGKRWVLRTLVKGKRCDIGLGSASLVTLAEAREKAAELRKVARGGGDPIMARRKARELIPTFEHAARQVHADNASTWRNPKHAAQWISTLEQYAFPIMAEHRVDQIDTPDILRVLSPIWLTKPETARRVRQRLSVVMDWAKAKGYRTGDNPVAGVSKGLPKQQDKDEHHDALPFDHVPAFIEQLRKIDASDTARLAFEFLILTAARTSEVLSATWDEIDTDNNLWTIPATRMKADKEHRVPLSARCVEILEQARNISDGNYVFAGRIRSKPLSNMTLLMTLRRMNVNVTAHGFRSTFRDWAAEKTDFTSDVCEMALAHVVKDKTEAAYRRGDLFEKRRELMNEWAAYAIGAANE